MRCIPAKLYGIQNCDLVCYDTELHSFELLQTRLALNISAIKAPTAGYLIPLVVRFFPTFN